MEPTVQLLLCSNVLPLASGQLLFCNVCPLTVQRPLPFAPPTSVSIVGSHATDTAVQGDNVVDVAVQLPASCFEHKDHLNHRYHAKRALYLATLSQQIRKQPAYADQHWGVFNDDVR